MNLPLMAKMLLICLILFSFFFRIASPTIDRGTVIDASEILADQGFVAMSLTLELLNESIITGPSPLTIFAASDSAFRETGQPSLSLLNYHFSPLKLSSESLKTLPYGTTIPTLLNNRSLVVTTSESDQQLSLNNAKLNDSAIFDVDEMVIYGIDNFFDPSFELDLTPSPDPNPNPNPNQSPIQNLGCIPPDRFASYPEIVNKLQNTHYSVFAQFLSLQLLGISPQTKLTIFVADDDEMSDHLKNFSDYASIFRRHVVPCKLTWTDLVNLEQGTSLPTFLDGYSIKITRSGEILVLNGIPVVLPDAYSTDTVVVHGIEKMMDFQVENGPAGSISDFHTGASPESLPSDYDGAYIGRLGNAAVCDASYVKRQQNRTPIIVASKVCLRPLAFDKIRINASVLEDLIAMEARIDPFSRVSRHLRRKKLPLSHFGCVASLADYRFASDELNAIGGSFISSFLDMQLTETREDRKLTIFAPVKETNVRKFWHFDENSFGYGPIFEYPKYIVPCKLTRADLLNIGNETVLPTLVKSFRFTIEVTQFGDSVAVNGVPVTFPNLYSSDILVIHGIDFTLDWPEHYEYYRW